MSILFCNDYGEATYLFFNAQSDSICQLHPDMKGRFHKTENVKQFNKAKNNDGSVIFYICNEKFSYSIKNFEAAVSLSEVEFYKLKMSNLNELIEVVNKDNPLYPDKVYGNVFIIEKTKEG
ncbi:hypothetical protein [Algoriphagus antarcticus]|nr:hypothetical protein [Algoriphagus antarcticus]